MVITPRRAGLTRHRSTLTILSSAALISAVLAAAARSSPADSPEISARADITDRNGVLLARSVPVYSAYANPRRVSDADATAKTLVTIFPDLDSVALAAKLRSAKSFVWISRHIDPASAQRIKDSTLLGVGLRTEVQRIYPEGALTAHVLGITDYESALGMSGAERLFDARLKTDRKPVALSIDVRAQTVLRDALVRAMASYHAAGAAGLVLDARTAQIVSLVSLPDFSPADRRSVDPFGYKDKLTGSIYELGGFFEIFTTAMALDDHRVTPATLLDATRPFRFQSTVLRDDEPSSRPLSVADVFAQSSIVGAALIAQRGTFESQVSALERLKLFAPMPIDGSEVLAKPLYHPRGLRPADRIAIGYGYGVALAPLQAAVVATGIANHGLLRSPTLLLDGGDSRAQGTRIVAESTSAQMRLLMRRAVTNGTGIQADVPGLEVGGKTGTSFKAVAGQYDKERRLTWFFAGFPMSDTPLYTVLVMLDEPHGTPATRERATSQWNAAPTAGEVISRLAPVLGVERAETSTRSL